MGGIRCGMGMLCKDFGAQERDGMSNINFLLLFFFFLRGWGSIVWRGFVSPKFGEFLNDVIAQYS